MASRDSEDWERIKSLGVYPYVVTPRQYERFVIEGIRVAKDYLLESGVIFPSINDIQILHKLSFGKVHPWAGELRMLGHEVDVGRIQCTPSQKVPTELRRLTDNMREVFEPKSAAVKKVFWLSYYHVSFEMIHPFADGNGRVGRAILGAQLDSVLGDNKRCILDRTEYIQALRDAQDSGSPTKLTQLLIESRRPVQELSPEQKLKRTRRLEL